MSWLNQISNFQSNYIKKVMFDLMKDKYHKNEQIIDRISGLLTTENDIKNFFTMVTDIYESAYMKSVEDHRQQLQKLGLKVNIVANQESKDG